MTDTPDEWLHDDPLDDLEIFDLDELVDDLPDIDDLDESLGDLPDIDELLRELEADIRSARLWDAIDVLAAELDVSPDAADVAREVLDGGEPGAGRLRRLAASYLALMGKSVALANRGKRGGGGEKTEG